MSAQRNPSDLATEIVKNVTGIKAGKRVRALGPKSVELAVEAIEAKSQATIAESIAILEKILERVQLWSTETSATQERRSEMKEEVEQCHQDLDLLIKRIQETAVDSPDESSSSESGDAPTVPSNGDLPVVPTNDDAEAKDPETETGASVASTTAQDDPKDIPKSLKLLGSATLIALFTLASILSTPEKRKALEDLEGDDAQSIINFLYKLLSEPANPSIPWLRKHTLLALRKLCGSSMLYPSWYVLKDITDYRPRDDGGMFGDIFSGKQGPLELCLKLVRLTGPEVEKVFRLYAKEAIVWGQLRHPNIAPFYGIFYLNETKEKICLVSPWMDNGNVEAYLKREPGAPRKQLVRDVALGLEYLHNENIIHGDLKATNILVDQLGRACIADFGSSIIRADRTVGFANATVSASSYSDRWVSPELLQEEARPTRASDVWALGCVCYEILSRRLPFHSMRGANANPRILAAVMRGTRPARRDKEPEAEPGDTIDDESWDLMNRCWSQDPEARPTCREILEELERQGVGQHGDERQDTTVHMTVASIDTVKVDLNEVQGILDQIDTVESAFSLISEARNILSTNRRLSEVVSSVLGDPRKSQAVQELKDERAQLLVDLLPLVSTRSFLSPSPQSDLARRATATLGQLSEILGLYPQRYVLSDITLDPELCAGDLCDIHRGRHGKLPLCVKVFKQADIESVPKVFVKDAIQWARLDHPNILPFYGIHYLDESPARFCVVTPWRESNTLGEYLQRNSSIPRENFIYDIISGLEYLHDQDIVHGRLKMSNVLVDYFGRACITDLGMSTVRTTPGLVSVKATEHPSWSAPELLGGESCGKPCDIWHFGCICYEVMTSKELPGQLTPPEPLEMDGMDDGMQELVRSCLARELRGRPTAQEILLRLEGTALRQRQEEVRSYRMHKNEVVKIRKTARTDLVMTAEKLLRVQYILYKINGYEYMPNHEARNLSAISDDLINLLTSVLSVPHKRRALQTLETGRAQLILDFVHLAAPHSGLQSLDLREWQHNLLYRLSVASGLHPQSYLLRDIVTDSEWDTDSEDQTYQGHHGEQRLHLQAVWLGKQAELSYTVEGLSRAASLWSQLHHPNVVPFYGMCFPDDDHKKLCLVTPWMANGNIRMFLDNNPLAPRKPLIYDIAKGLQYLHSRDIIHCNILGETVSVNDIGRACITHFFGSWVGPGTGSFTISSLVTEGLDPSWQAPESLGDEYEATQATDIWRFGCVCYEVMTRQDPYYHISTAIETLRAIIEGKLPIRPEENSASDLDQIDNDMWNLMNRCWARKPEDRPTADQIVEELESWGLGKHKDDEFQMYVLEEHQVLRNEMRKYPNVEIDFAKVQEILEEVNALQDD